MRALRGHLRGAIGTLGLRRFALVVMTASAGAVARRRVIIVLDWRDRTLLEEMVHPVRSGVENEKQKCGGNCGAGLATGA